MTAVDAINYTKNLASSVLQRLTIAAPASNRANYHYEPLVPEPAVASASASSSSRPHAMTSTGVEDAASALGKGPEVRTTTASDGVSPTTRGSRDASSPRDGHLQPLEQGYSNASDDDQAVTQGIHILETKSQHWWSYFTTADFWIVVALGQVLALCITATNTFTSFLTGAHVNIPAFQTLFNYILIFLIYTTIFMVRDGPREFGRIIWRDGWKYLIMSFLDVEGNYFTVLAYEYTNILSAQLINFWSIVCVVIISFLLLKVRYKLFQIIGILICCGGMGILLASDRITHANDGATKNALKGDLFALLGATLYGTSNVFEEWLVSKAPMHHVLSYLGLFGMIINGVQAAIFDRHSVVEADWTPHIAGYLVGYTLCLTLFYTLAPLILRMGSAAVFDISLLTANFWGVIIGIHVFGLKIHYLYPIAFVCIIIGLVTYFLSGSILGDSKKPWLGENQESGVAGIGTAKLKAIAAARLAQDEPENGTSSSPPTATVHNKEYFRTMWGYMTGKEHSA